MDNKTFDIQSEGRDDFARAMGIAMDDNYAVGWSVKDNALVLYKYKSDKAIELPFKMNLQQATDFAWNWLSEAKPSTREPDHDGDNGKGFHVHCGEWGRVDGCHAAFVKIEPIWAMYGK